MAKEKKKSNTWIIIVIGVIIVILFIAFNQGGGSRAVCGTHTETYTSSAKGCDKLNNCECLHKSWGGLGACDSCECTREVSNC